MRKPDRAFRCSPDAAKVNAPYFRRVYSIEVFIQCCHLLQTPDTLATPTLINWDPVKDINHITGYSFSIVVPAEGPFKNWADFLAFAKANPGNSDGLTGTLTSPHLTTELIAQ